MARPEGTDDESVPKLTLGQRILTALPNLQRQPHPPAMRATSTRGGPTPTPRNGTSADVDGDVVRPDAVIGATGSSASGTRLRDVFLKPPAGATTAKSDAYADMSVADLRQAMKYLDERERGIPLLIGPLLAVLDIVLTVVTLHTNPPVGHKHHADPGSILALGIGSAVVALLVVVAALSRRRSFTIFALLFAGYGGGLVTMVPAWVVAGWLFIRFNRMQKVVVARTGGPAAARQAAAKRRAERSQPRPRLGRKEKTPEPTGPAANKRYTPPKA
ncbi:MAG TPA: hypothetical protein DCQ30_09035 [Acidimicrobiaceae bacterium]|nr:hypothetical protein [Acidimicrobiaceae bacterium]